MTAATVLTLSNGKGLDLLNPRAEDIDFAVIAEHLAKENRYNGATKNRCYSVAEHSVRCAMAALNACGDRRLAAYLLLHDGHEAFLKDDTTPKKRALAAMAQESFGMLAEHVVKTFDLLTYRFDVAIHEAAGLPWPPSEHVQVRIKLFDLTLFVTEWRDLMGNQEHPNWAPYATIEPLADEIIPVTWQEARADFVKACYALLPSARTRGLSGIFAA